MKWMIPLVLVLSGCNPAPDSAPADTFATQTQALDKARAVGDQLNDAAAMQREQIEASTGQ
jgi:hypothetical protein